MSALRLAWLDLVRHKTMTLLVLASLALTVGSAGILVSLTLLLGGLSLAGVLIGRFESKSLTFAALKAMGFGSREILAMFAWEGTLLGLGACVLGGILDGLLFPLVRSLLGSGLPPASILHSTVWHSWPLWIMMLSATVLVTGILYWRIAVQNPRSALQGLS